MDPFEAFDNVEEGDRIIADVDPRNDQDRGVVTLEATRRSNPFGTDDAGFASVKNTTTDQEIGKLREGEPDSPLAIERRSRKVGGDPTVLAEVNDITTTDRRDLDPVGIGRDRNSGEFTPDNVEPAPRSPSDRDPDDGEFVTPDPRPITDIGRKRDDGLFDLF
jgi:hypothetical protein